MNPIEQKPSPPAFTRLATVALSRPGAPFDRLPDRLIVVDISRQQLGLVIGGAPALEYRISTAAAGIGCTDGSGKTPEGWHRVHSLIGEHTPLGTVFESREPTGRIWQGQPDGSDLILTRIVRLEGLEENVNRGPGCDSLERYIYIHGTNHEHLLGQPASHGCIRMANADVRDLFDHLSVGDAVVIVEGGADGHT